MEFLFVCPYRNETFRTAAFRIVEHRGVRVDANGQKHLDAHVQVDIACPHCGEKHRYAADELVCPFEGG